MDGVSTREVRGNINFVKRNSREWPLRFWWASGAARRGSLRTGPPTRQTCSRRLVSFAFASVPTKCSTYLAGFGAPSVLWGYSSLVAGPRPWVLCQSSSTSL